MAAITNELQGANGFWRHTSSTGATTALVTAKSGWTPVIEGFSLSATGGAGIGVITINCSVTTAVIALRWHVGNAGVVVAAGSNMRLATVDGEGLTLNLTGTVPANIGLTIWGRYLPTNTPISDNKTGAVA